MHKLRNGKRVEMADEEIAAMKKKWADAKVQQQAEIAEEGRLEIKRDELMKRLGITKEDWKILCG